MNQTERRQVEMRKTHANNLANQIAYGLGMQDRANGSRSGREKIGADDELIRWYRKGWNEESCGRFNR